MYKNFFPLSFVLLPSIDMFSIQIKLLIIGIFGGLLTVFVLQNTELIALVLLGKTVATLPVGIWLLFGVLMGILTSFILQFINTFSPRSFPVQNNNNIPNYSAPKTPRSPQPKTYVKSELQQKEIIENYQEKTIKDSPQTVIQDNFNKPVSDTENIKKEPETVQNNSVYSYSYPRQQAKNPNKIDNIYDANYRVINPPIIQNEDEDSSNQDENDEDWI